MHKIVISNPNALIFAKLADLCLDSMFIEVCCQVYNFVCVYENINIFLSNDHIWKYPNLNSLIS